MTLPPANDTAEFKRRCYQTCRSTFPKSGCSCERHGVVVCKFLMRKVRAKWHSPFPAKPVSPPRARRNRK